MADNRFKTDAKGTRYRVKQLKEQQTNDAQLGHLFTHFSSHPSKGLTPAKLADILIAAEQGDLIAQSELAEDMEEKDTHIFSELQKRKLALLGVDFVIKPPRNATPQEEKDTEMLNEIIEDLVELDELIFNMADGIHKGFSNSEITWNDDSGLWLPNTIEHRPCSWFMCHPARMPGQNRNELRLRDNSECGAELQPFTWISHIHKTKTGDLSRNGLARVLAWPYLFKNYSVRDLAEFLEIYGLPLRLGKYPTGASDDEKRTLLRAVMSIGHNAGGIIPKGMEIEFNAAASGDNKPFEYMISQMERGISKAVLGGTLTSQADGKSSTNALGNVHNEVRQELRNSDLKQIANTLTRDLVLPLYMFNGKSYQSTKRCPRFEFDITEPEDLKLYADSLPGLVTAGVQIPTQWVHDKLQIPEPQGNEPVLGQVQAAAGEQKQNAILKIAALKAKSQEDPQKLQNEQLSSNMSSMLASFTSSIEQIVNQADSLEDLQVKLGELNLSTEEAAEVLQQAFVAAELSGQYDVSEGD